MVSDPQVRDHLLRKPFANLREAPAMLYRLGLALECLDLGPGHVVLDFGAGSCWVSLLLNRLGCATISCDVSRTALALGEEVFERDPFARADLAPRFVAFDGHVLPLEDRSVDRALCFDAFHHVPNQAAVLEELHRVLRPGGRLVMAEPGHGHAHSGAARFEMERYGVLERELVLEELISDARRAGFDGFEIKPYPDVDALTLSAEAHLQMLGGDHSLYSFHHALASMRELHVMALLKGPSCRDSRNPGTLRARIDTPLVTRLEGGAGREVSVRVDVTNTGDTLWLASTDEGGGYVCLGGHLHDGAGRPLRVEWFRTALPRDVAPGQTVTLDARFGLPETAGDYVVRFDLVDDRIIWFSQAGSPTQDLRLRVSWSDSLDPHRFEARIEPLGAFPPEAATETFPLHLRVTNIGDTTWLSGPGDRKGTVQIGVQHLGPDGAIRDRDYFRAALPRSVRPGESIEILTTAPLGPGAGHHFAVDLVAEQVCWFATHGSKPLLFVLRA